MELKDFIKITEDHISIAKKILNENITCGRISCAMCPFSSGNSRIKEGCISNGYRGTKDFYKVDYQLQESAKRFLEIAYTNLGNKILKENIVLEIIQLKDEQSAIRISCQDDNIFKYGYYCVDDNCLYNRLCSEIHCPIEDKLYDLSRDKKYIVVLDKFIPSIKNKIKLLNEKWECKLK